MSDKVLEIRNVLAPQDMAASIVGYWNNWNQQRQEKIDDWEELDRYLFATDTSETGNSSLPWKNSTTTPKLTQISDNLFANYLHSIFPNDRWLKWEGFDRKSVSKEKAKYIQAYMSNKLREGGFRQVMEDCLQDYIRKGNTFAMPTFEDRYTMKDGERVQKFRGPKAVRIDPLDIVFNPIASNFDHTPKIVRSVHTTGELKKLAQTHPEHAFWEEAIERRNQIRKILSGYSYEDVAKANLLEVDGFGNLYEYYMSDYVEVLEFYGDYHDHDSGELYTNHMITVIDRSVVVRNEPAPTYDGEIPIYHQGWRKRNGNLWCMGPLDNLVGMQYRIDHLENLKADAMDLIVHPPLKIIGDVEPFEWGPEAIVHIDGEGDVQEIQKNVSNLVVANNEIQLLEQKMELYAGAPREAAGIRSPGEKTAFEVQALENAAGRIYQAKIIQFEIFMEKLLNAMLETAHRHFGDSEEIRYTDQDLGVVSFSTITKEDITAKGIIRPIGARNFAQKAQELQNIIGVFQSPIADLVRPHTSGINLSKYLDDVLDVRGWEIFKPNILVSEMQETQALSSQADQDLANEQAAQDVNFEGGFL